MSTSQFNQTYSIFFIHLQLNVSYCVCFLHQLNLACSISSVYLSVEPPPNGVDFYIHRAGRTGRKGKPGRAILLYSDRDRYFMREVCIQCIYTILEYIWCVCWGNGCKFSTGCIFVEPWVVEYIHVCIFIPVCAGAMDASSVQAVYLQSHGLLSISMSVFLYQEVLLEK